MTNTLIQLQLQLLQINRDDDYAPLANGDPENYEGACPCDDTW